MTSKFMNAEYGMRTQSLGTHRIRIPHSAFGQAPDSHTASRIQ
jgi:hypothetical protein